MSSLGPHELVHKGSARSHAYEEPCQYFRVPKDWQQSGDHRQLFYLHARVLCSREDRRTNDALDDDIVPTFLCQLDLPSTRLLAQSSRTDGSVGNNCDSESNTEAMGEPVGRLVLGLNNHHVGSYYWARSAGAGAAMEAPGIVLADGNVLRWESPELEKCNSNDGKRSEWVSFLRPGDQVQLVPMPDAIRAHVAHYGSENSIFGVSMRGRPLGSEPLVVCQYQLRSIVKT